MDDLSDWDRMDAAGFRVSMIRSVRWLAWFTLGIGAGVLALGFGARDAPLVMIGAVLAAAGLWNVWRPSVAGMLVDGVAMIASGAFLIFQGLADAGSGPLSAGKGIAAGMPQIIWAFRRLALLPLAWRQPNDRQAIAHLEQLVRVVSRRDVKHDPTVVEFRSGRFNLHRNRIGFFDVGAVNLLEQQVVRLERRGDIWIERVGTSVSGRTLKVEVRLSDYSVRGTMRAEHLERFEQWKLGMAPGTKSAA